MIFDSNSFSVFIVDNHKTIQTNIKNAISQKDLNKLTMYMKVYDNSKPTSDDLALEANQMIMFLQAKKCEC